MQTPVAQSFLILFETNAAGSKLRRMDYLTAISLAAEISHFTIMPAVSNLLQDLKAIT